jgi:transposase-like protein
MGWVSFFGMSAPPGRDELETLYHKDALSYEEIARLFGTNRTQVMRWIKRAGIPPRTRAEARVIAAKKFPNSEKQRESARITSAANRQKITEASYEKMVATRKERGVNYRRGAGNHMWRGGKSEGKLNAKVWTRRARECYDRDGWVCQDCRCECLSTNAAKAVDPKRRVQAHHIVARRNGGGNELENLVTLCLSCHRKREALFASALFA